MHLLRRVQRTFFALFLISVLAFFRGGPALAGPIGAITSVYGTVTLKRPGSTEAKSAERGDRVSVGDDIRTGKDSAAQVTLTDESFANLFDDSWVRMNQYSFDRSSDRRTARVRVLAGKVRFVVYKASSMDSGFFVETDNVIAAFGPFGDVGISVRPLQTEVSVLQSSAQVRNISPLVVGEVSVGINQKTLVRGKEAPSSPVTLLPSERRDYMRDIGTSRRVAGARGRRTEARPDPR
jgi:hypothetical protein